MRRKIVLKLSADFYPKVKHRDNVPYIAFQNRSGKYFFMSDHVYQTSESWQGIMVYQKDCVLMDSMIVEDRRTSKDGRAYTVSYLIDPKFVRLL